MPCTQAKQSHEPFPSTVTHTTAIGNLTHIDLWGKYQIQSINGNQYYILFVDDYSRYVTVQFLKTKNEAAKAVQNYLSHLITQGINTRAIRVDRGTEFVNDNLQTWCLQRGIEIQMTAPYSSSQNGTAERMNCTLVELARAMLTARKVPEFLWEFAVAHAAYLRNRSFTRAVPDATPYERRFGKKPDVSHLREFGTPVWILSEGPSVPRKMLPKSVEKLFIGFDDAARAVKYFSKDSRKVLISRNFRFIKPSITLPTDTGLTHPIDDAREGEAARGVHDKIPGPDTMRIDSLPSRKRPADEDGDVNPRKTRGVKIDFKRLDNPFSDNEEDEDAMIAIQMIYDESYYAAANDAPLNLKEAKKSEDWDEWESGIRAELEQLEAMGTWELVPKPPGVVPIPNKWTFVKKTDIIGLIKQFKARLVAKGCSQRPGFDFNETYSPVVRLETVRLVLAMVPDRDLRIQQMDVKGAYLNGVLKEDVYMKQPEGYEDGTDRVCHLLKTLYGLKQLGREWNNQLNQGMQTIGFVRLISDPCAYIRGDDKDFQIVTVWVDDLLIFATSDKGMRETKAQIAQKWRITDLGEPAKIIGIEVKHTRDSISISQKVYINSILRKEGLDRANPVATPLDPNVRIEPNPDQSEGEDCNSYARLLGELQYLASATRPDIAFAVHRLASFTRNPSLQYQGMLKRIVRYLAGTQDYGITYRKSYIPKSPILGYANAAFGNTDERKSTTGIVFTSGGGAISWRSKKQTLVALSTTEAEYIALAHAGADARWLRNIYLELGFPLQDALSI